jgi:hypothetical protein
VAARRDFPVMVLFWGNLDAGAALIDRHPDTASSSTTLASFSRACRTRPRSPGPTSRRYWNSLGTRTR